MTEVDSNGKRRVGFWRWVWRIFAASFATLVVVLALAIGLFRVALPLLPDYQERIEAAATKAIGYPLEVGSIDARWRLKGPELLFKEVELLSRDRNEKLLNVGRLEVVLDLFALAKGFAIKPAEITLSGMVLTVERTIDGQLVVQGKAVRLPADAGTASEAVAWSVPEGRFGLRNVQVRYTDHKTGEPEVNIPDIDLDAEIRRKQIKIDGDVQLPGNMGRRVELTLDMDGDPSRAGTLDWQAFIKAPRVDLEELSEWRPTVLPISSTGEATMSLWLSGKGERLDTANLQIELNDLALIGTGANVATVRYEQIAGRFIWESTDERWRLQGKNVLMRQSDRDWPAGDMDVTMHRHDADTLQYSISADHIDLGGIDALIGLAGDLPWTREWHRRGPAGVISNFDGFVTLRDSTVLDFGLTADAEGLALAAADGLPGFSGIDAHLFGGNASGGLDLRSKKASFSAPGVLREVIGIDALNMTIRWTKDGVQPRQTRVDNIRIVTEELTTRGSISFEQATDSELLHAVMELTVDQLDLAGTYKYFPVNRMSPTLLKWLDNALLSGTGGNGSFYLNGPLKKFPFADPTDGEFSAQIDFADATLHYAANWPEATALNATVMFERNSLRSQIDSVNLMAVPMQNGLVTIADFKQPLITLDGAISADVAQMREYLDNTPLVAKWSQEWPNFSINGAASSTMHIDFSPRQPRDTRYQIKLDINDGEARYRDWPQRLNRVAGTLNFSEKGIDSEALNGVLLGEAVAIEIHPALEGQAGKATDIFLRGRARSQSLGEHLHDRLGEVLSGETEWVAQTRLSEPGNTSTPFTIRLQSPLESMQVLLPRPLAKAADVPRFLDATLIVPAEGVIETVIEYGGDTNIHALFAGTDKTWKVQRGEIRFGGGAAALPEEGLVRAVGNIEEFDVSEMLEFTARFAGDDPWVELTHADLGITELQGFGQNFLASDVEAVHADTAWQVKLLGERLSGSLQIPDTITPENPVVGNFEILKWASSENDSPLDPSEAPSLKIAVDDFSFNQYQFGAMTLHVEARENIVALRELKTVASGFETRATGSWTFGSEDSTTFVVAELTSDNVRATLRGLQLAEFLESDQATAKVELTWPSGWTPDFLQTVEGTIHLEIGEGTLQSVDPGAGRVFGLLSIGALPRRLSLDFRDVFESGFSFDSIAGDFTIRDGSAYTENLALKGPAANVGIVGRTGLVAKDYDQTAVVYANFGSSLPLAGTLAGGPAVGAALLVFSEIFKKPLRQMGRVSYQISGSWDEPDITKTGSERPAPAETPDGATETGPEAPESVE